MIAKHFQMERLSITLGFGGLEERGSGNAENINVYTSVDYLISDTI